MADPGDELKKLKGNDTFELASAVKLLTAAIKDQINGTKTSILEAQVLVDEQREYRKQLEDSTEAQEKHTAAVKNAGEKLLKFGDELVKIGEAGIKFASTIGVSATAGVKVELANRNAIAKQLFKLDADRAVSLAQQQAAQKSLTDSFISTREGFELSAKGTQAFAANLKGGFKSEFELTNESLRALVTTGMSNVKQFEEFRKASGRASLSSGQFATIVGKNTLSFLLYGKSFAKAAVDAERLGINLASVQASQEGLVTNLDGAIDTVAQLNQVGAQLDFGRLIQIAEQEGPDALMAYARATVPRDLLQSASTRALFKQLGISAEDFLKAGGEQQSAAQKIEEQMTQAATKVGTFAKKLTEAARVKDILESSYYSVAKAAAFAAVSLYALGASGLMGMVMNLIGKFGGLSAVLGMVLPVLAIIAGIFGMAKGRSMVEQGNVGAGIAMGAGSGALSGAGVGAIVGSVIPGVGTAVGAGIGALLGAGVGLVAAGTAKPANDMFSAGYGSRILVTPNGAFALNNADDIIAGTNLFPKGALQMGGDTSQLSNKIDKLIDVIANATTTINVGGITQEVPRMKLVGVYSRNEVN